MTPISSIIARGQEWLLRRVLQYARDLGYTTATSLQEDAWRGSIAELNRQLLKALEAGDIRELTAGADYGKDPVALVGTSIARRHWNNNVGFETFFGLMKYYRQSYLDLIRGEGFERSYEESCRLFIERFFDRLEIGFLAEWCRYTRGALLTELKQSESRFAALAEQAPVGIIEADAGGECLYVNERWCAIAGASQKKAAGRGWLRFIHPDDRRKVTAEWYDAAREQREFSLEYRFRAPSGEITWVIGSAQAKKAESGEVIGYLGTIQDITKQKMDQQEIHRFNLELERRVAERTDQLRALSEENEKKFQEISALYRMSNNLLSTINLNKLAHLILTSLTSGENPFFDRAMLFLINERSATMQGMLGVSRFSATQQAVPAADDGDKLASRWDISAEEMARQQNSEFSKQVRASRMELDKSSNVASRAVLEKKLLLVADITKEKCVDVEFVRRFGIKSCAIAPLMAKDRVIGIIVVDNSQQQKQITPDDLRFLQLITNQAGMAIENSILYNRIEEGNRSLREAHERLIHGERLSAIGEMATGIAHEVKGPLVSIGGFARRLEKKLATVSVEHSHAATIVREVKRLEKLLSEILSFTKKTTICYDACTINSVIEDSLAIISAALEESGVKIIITYPVETITLLADQQQLKQVFFNLFVNAQEVMRSGGELRITVAPTRLNGKGAVSVKVADTGGGIPLPSLNKIFNSFFTTKEAGTGLGLPIANRIVTNHGGKIQVANKKECGAEFNVILPLCP